MPIQPLDLSDEYCERFRELILERSGLLFGPKRRGELARGLSAVIANAGCENLDEYYRLLQQSRTDNELWDDLIGALTVGETYFFRDAAQFDALRQHILVELIARHHDDRRLRIWSAGCAGGEEPYSVAILLRQLLPDISSWNVTILATDINKRALQHARNGRYGDWSFRQTDPAIRERYFTLRDRSFELVPNVRDMVTFGYLNLVEDVYPALTTNTNAMDLILFRNVSIYLSKSVIQKLAERFHRCLVPEGWLIVGAVETSGDLYSQFAVCNFAGATVYQKTACPSALTADPIVPPYAQPAIPSSFTQPAVLRPPEIIEGSLPAARPPTLPVQSAMQADSYYKEGLALLEQGHHQEATNRFIACIAHDPDFAPAYHQVARDHADRGRLEEARSWCQQAIKRDPLLVEAHYTLALIHQEEGALDQAIDQLKKTLYLEPGFVLAYFNLANLHQQAGRRDETASYRRQAMRLAAKMSPNDALPGSDGLTAGRLLTMVRATT